MFLKSKLRISVFKFYKMLLEETQLANNCFNKKLHKLAAQFYSV